MAIMDMPTMLASSYVSNTFNPTDVFTLPTGRSGACDPMGEVETSRIKSVRFPSPPAALSPPPPPLKKDTPMALRYVQVFIADTNKSLSLEDRILFKGEAKMTDLDDNELFFELDIKDILAKHNAKRVKVVNKDAVPQPTGHVFLEPARVRDLKMTVVTIASFG